MFMDSRTPKELAIPKHSKLILSASAPAQASCLCEEQSSQTASSASFSHKFCCYFHNSEGHRGLQWIQLWMLFWKPQLSFENWAKVTEKKTATSRVFLHVGAIFEAVASVLRTSKNVVRNLPKPLRKTINVLSCTHITDLHLCAQQLNVFSCMRWLTQWKNTSTFGRKTIYFHHKGIWNCTQFFSVVCLNVLKHLPNNANEG